MIRGIYRMTASQFRKAIDAGVFGERHVELLGGIPFVMSENPPHILASIRLFAGLSVLAASPQWVVNKEHRLELGQWLPLPDLVVLRGPDTTYGSRWARAGDVAILVEIADSSYARDSGVKLRRYAGFGIPVYWIVDLNRRVVEVRTVPSGTGKNAQYARCDGYQESDCVPVFLDGQEVGSIAVAGILPNF
jgi:Putative restriction endonuclease